MTTPANDNQARALVERILVTTRTDDAACALIQLCDLIAGLPHADAADVSEFVTEVAFEHTTARDDALAAFASAARAA